MKVLFVCSGNTCRSPMAEGIFRKMLRERGLQEEILCQSAGLFAAEGEPASPNAVTACREIGVDISGHCSRKLSAEEMPVWDAFFPMTDTHAYVLSQAGVPEGKIYLPRGIQDPYGGNLERYRACRDQICQELETFLQRLLEGRQA